MRDQWGQIIKVALLDYDWIAGCKQCWNRREEPINEHRLGERAQSVEWTLNPEDCQMKMMQKPGKKRDSYFNGTTFK